MLRQAAKLCIDPLRIAGTTIRLAAFKSVIGFVHRFQIYLRIFTQKLISFDCINNFDQNLVVLSNWLTRVRPSKHVQELILLAVPKPHQGPILPNIFPADKLSTRRKSLRMTFSAECFKIVAGKKIMWIQKISHNT